MNLNKVLALHIRSYGFFHSGRERHRVRVVKRCWEFIPGSAVYGVVGAALLRLDGIGPASYDRLLRGVQEQRIRFTPLLPAAETLESADAYCRQAMLLQAALYGLPLPEADQADEAALQSQRALIRSTPHAPLSRRTLQIHESDLYSLAVHRSEQDYYGFVFIGDDDLIDLLQPALRLLPFMPFGGKGKFELAEGEMLGAPANLGAFMDDWLQELDRKSSPLTVRLLTPLPLQDGQFPHLLSGAEELNISRLRRYRVWREGRYYNPLTQALEVFSPDEGGQESLPVLGIPEGSSFTLPANRKADVVRAFVEGEGNPAWTYLGWGQVVIE
jgi:hypothetical protein